MLLPLLVLVFRSIEFFMLIGFCIHCVAEGVNSGGHLIWLLLKFCFIVSWRLRGKAAVIVLRKFLDDLVVWRVLLQSLGPLYLQFPVLIVTVVGTQELPFSPLEPGLEVVRIMLAFGAVRVRRDSSLC